MPSPSPMDQYVSFLLSGDRPACRKFIQDALAKAKQPSDLYTRILWPAMEQIEKIYRADQINIALEHMATRINRTIADQLQLSLPYAQRNGKKILIACADGEPEELGAQMCADLFESQGWEVCFLGGGVPNDEIVSLAGQIRPELLLIFGTQPGGVPGVRKLVDRIRDLGVNPTMNIMVSGGVFNRADGLWQEVNADLMARTVADAIPMAEAAGPRLPPPPKPGGVKKRRRRRSPLLVESSG